MMTQSKQGIRRNFENSLLTLASEPGQQIQMLAPGCVTCELRDDFEWCSGIYLQEFQSQLTEEQKIAIVNIQQQLVAIAEEDSICFNNEVLERQSWESVRKLAGRALPLFSLGLDNVPLYKEISPGIWQRK